VTALNLMPFSDGNLPYHEALPVDMISRGSLFIYVIYPYHLDTAFRAGFRYFFLYYLGARGEGTNPLNQEGSDRIHSKLLSIYPNKKVIPYLFLSFLPCFGSSDIPSIYRARSSPPL
jgi:hypothetical protein